MAEQLTLDILKSAIAGTAAAFRCRATLQPAAGVGTKVFPPTYAGAVYATEKRRLPGCKEPVECVLLDSVQSQANRMEEGLQQAIDAGRLNIPLIEVDFTPYFPGNDQPEDMRLLDPVGKVTSLQVPHRIADAILRDSLIQEDGNKPFRANNERDESRYGQRLRRVSMHNATALFELCPTALVFGMWDSTGPKGGLGAKFERAIVSEIVGINSPEAWRESRNRGLRQDPLGIRRGAPVIGTRMDWRLAAAGEEGAIRPSEIVHGNVPFESENCGVTIDHGEQMIVLSFPALRRLRFPVNDKHTIEVDNAGRTVLAALGLCAAALAAEAGIDLRSRCLLWPTTPLKWELLDKPGDDPKPYELESRAGIELLNAAVAEAEKLGLSWREARLVLTPSPQLVRLVVRSQQLAIEQGAEDGEGG